MRLEGAGNLAAEFLTGTTGIGLLKNVAKILSIYKEVIWITIFILGMLGLLFDVTLRKIIDKTIPWRGKRLKVKNKILKNKIGKNFYKS